MSGEVSGLQARYFLLKERGGLKNLRTTLTFLLVGSLLVSVSLFAISFIIWSSDFGFGRSDFYRYYKGFHDRSFDRAVAYSNLPEDNNITIPRIDPNRLRKSTPPVKDYKLVCYYNFPNPNVNLNRQLTLKQLDAGLCTHINVGFASVVNNTIYLRDDQKNGTREVVNLKRLNGQLKVLLSVSGDKASGFKGMVVNHSNRKSFIKSMLDHVKEYKLDGIDLDWEFPNNDVYDKKERMHFTQLLHEIREEIDRQKKHRFLITVAVASPYFIAMNSYDIAYMNDYVDYINLMTYDFHFYTKLTPFTGINSPLYSLPDDVGIFGTLNINYSANFWVSQGMDRNKIVVGLPTYGHTYKLINPNNNGISAPAIGFGRLGLNGFIDFGEVCNFLFRKRILPNFDVVSKSPYVTYGEDWISFDDVKSLTYKTEFIRQNDFAGAMVYSLNSDDYTGACSRKRMGEPGQSPRYFPLIRKIRDILLAPPI